MLQKLRKIAKLALLVGLVSAFSATHVVLAQHPPDMCSGQFCSGSCNTKGGNCCGIIGETCFCLGVNSGC